MYTFFWVNNTLSYGDAVALCEESTRNNNYNTNLHEVQRQQKQVESALNNHNNNINSQKKHQMCDASTQTNKFTRN